MTTATSTHHESEAHFERLFAAHRGWVYGLCLRKTRNPEDAEDLAQQVFLKLYRYFPTIKRPEPEVIRAWLKQVVIQLVTRHFTYLRPRRCHTSLDALLEENPGALPTKRLTALNDPILWISLHRAIDRLPKRQRTNLILKYFYGYEHEEIAQMFNCVPGTSKSQCYKACRNLSDLLGYSAVRETTSL